MTSHYKCMGIWKCFQFRINRSKPLKSFRIIASHPICADLGATGDGGSPEVKWRHNPFFTNKSRQDGDRDAQMLPNDLARRAASEDVQLHIDPLGSWSDLGLAWPGVKFSNWPFKVKKYMCRNSSMRRARWCHFFRIFHIEKVNNEKPSPWKTTLSFDDLCSQNYWPRVKSHRRRYRGIRRAPQSFFLNSSKAIKLLEIIAIVWKKNVFFLKIWPWWPLVALILTWPENELPKLLRSRRGLSYAFYRLSLSSVVFEFGGGAEKAPARNWTFQSPPGIGLTWTKIVVYWPLPGPCGVARCQAVQASSSPGRWNSDRSSRPSDWPWTTGHRVAAVVVQSPAWNLVQMAVLEIKSVKLYAFRSKNILFISCIVTQEMGVVLWKAALSQCVDVLR